MGSIVAEEERLIVIVNLGWLNIHLDCFIGFSLLIVKEEGRNEGNIFNAVAHWN